LDSTAVHPESYALVEQIATSLSAPIDRIIATPALLDSVDRSRFSAGTFTLTDILEELRKPGRDSRDKFVTPIFHEGVREFADLQPDMVLEGVVTNVTKFGAFVDIGVHQDGLVHVSELSNRYIKDPNEAVRAGQIVTVKVLSADAATKRIALSMKALLAPSGSALRPSPRSNTKSPAGKPASRSQKQAIPQPQTMEDKLAALSTRWKVR
jgi:uncharacterized protein